MVWKSDRPIELRRKDLQHFAAHVLRAHRDELETVLLRTLEQLDPSPDKRFAGRRILPLSSGFEAILRALADGTEVSLPGLEPHVLLPAEQELEAVMLGITAQQIAFESFLAGYARDVGGTLTISRLVNEQFGHLLRESVARIVHRREDALSKSLASVYEILRAQVESSSLPEAYERVLAALGSNMGWECGVLWLIDPAVNTLRVAHFWQSAAADAAGCGVLADATSFAPGVGLPGKVWATREPAWALDGTDELDVPGGLATKCLGLHGAFAFPVRSGDQMLGVIAFFSRQVLQPDAAQIELVGAVGGQLGLYIERIQTRDELVRSNRKLAGEVARNQGILEAALDAIITIDHAGNVVDFNPAAERMFGYVRAEVVGKEMASLVIPERLRDAHRHGLQHYLATGEGPALSRRIELPARHRDGTEFPVELAITPIKCDPPLFTGHLRDLAERKRAEEQQKQIETMRQLDLLKDQFLSILSHELRTPINAITGFGSVLEDEVAGPLNRQQHAYLARLMSGADVLLSLVDDLLDMSRIQAGKFSLSLAAMAFREVATDVIATLEPLATRKQQQLVLEVPENLPPVVGDARRISQVLTNLVGNALKFTPEGGTIRVFAVAGADVLRCEIRDNGPGIAAEDLPKLFRRFGQLNTSQTRSYGGTGLGLSISKAIIEAHGGEIGARSEPGQGSTFWFSLPLMRSHGADEADAAN